MCEGECSCISRLVLKYACSTPDYHRLVFCLFPELNVYDDSGMTVHLFLFPSSQLPEKGGMMVTDLAKDFTNTSIKQINQ